MTKKPIISIIMASYNHADFIGNAIQSIQQQDYDAWELLVADDASTDRTLEVLKSYSNDARIKIFPFKINRQYHMRNFIAEKARGDYLAFLNSDDIFYPGKLSKQVEQLEKNMHIAAVFTHVHCIDENTKRINGHALENRLAAENKTRQQWLRHFFFFGNQLCLSSAMVRRDCFEKVGAFNPLLIQIGDLDLWVKICLKNEIYVIPEPLTARRMLNENLSRLTSASMSRTFLEEQQVYAHYFSPAAIEQATGIFPELMHTLPEDTPQWRYYLLCRTATALPIRSRRLLGYTKLHELLKDETTKLQLQQKNPRLLRTLFFSEGTAGLSGDSPEVEWEISYPDPDGTGQMIQLLSCWTNAAGNSAVCLSFPNPHTSTQLCISLKGQPIFFKCGRIRLYDQQSGTQIFDSDSTRKPVGFNTGPCYRFPKINFSAFPSKWIDIEIERIPIQLDASRHKVRKKLARLFRKFTTIGPMM